MKTRCVILALVVVFGWFPPTTTNAQSAAAVKMSVDEYKKGRAYLEAKDYMRAIEHLNNSLAIVPSSGAYMDLGITYHSLKRYSDAIWAFKQVIRTVPNNAEVRLRLAMAYHNLGIERASGASASKDLTPFQNAETEAREAIRLKPDYQQAYFYLGAALYLQKKNSDALAALQQAVRLRADDKASLYLLGFSYVKLGKKEEAMQIYRKVAALDKEYAQGLLTEINKPAANNPAANAAPGTAEYYLNDGHRYRAAKGFAKAIEAYKKAIALKPGLSNGHFWLGFCYFQLDQFRNALPALQQAVRLKPNDDANQAWLGSTYYKLEQYQNALPPLKEALRLNPSGESNHFWIGVNYYELKQFPLAVASLQEAIRLNAKSPYNHYHLGQVYLNGLKQNDKAESAYREAIRLKPDYDAAHNQLGLIHLHRKQYQNALTEFQEAVRLDPKTTVYLQNVGLAYFRLGKKAEALKVCERLQTIDAVKAKELYDFINKSSP